MKKRRCWPQRLRFESVACRRGARYKKRMNRVAGDKGARYKSAAEEDLLAKVLEATESLATEVLVTKALPKRPYSLRC